MIAALALLITLVYSSPIWIPLVFLAYAVGRRRVGLLFFFALITAEAISLAIYVLIWAETPIPGFP